MPWRRHKVQPILRQDFQGIPSDGRVVPDSFFIHAAGIPTAEIMRAAHTYAESLSPAQ